jgi:hypothetical protein
VPTETTTGKGTEAFEYRAITCITLWLSHDALKILLEVPSLLRPVNGKVHSRR